MSVILHECNDDEKDHVIAYKTKYSDGSSFKLVTKRQTNLLYLFHNAATLLSSWLLILQRKTIQLIQ